MEAEQPRSRLHLLLASLCGLQMCWVLSRLRASLGWQPPAPSSLAGKEQPHLWLNAETEVCMCGCSSGKAVTGLLAVKDGADCCKVQQITFFKILFSADEKL